MADSARKPFFPRALTDRWDAASDQFPVLALAGPRQVGKTTLLDHIRGPERRIVSLDDPARREEARRDPRGFLQRFPPPVLIDEVQYAPELLPFIKIAVDEDRRPGAFWLTGSQQFQLMRGMSESLAGRVGIVRLLGFSWRECDQRIAALPPFVPTREILDQREATAAVSSIEAAYARIWAGTMPALVTGQVLDRDLFWSSYVQTYLERDVRDLAQVGDLAAFHRFLRACAARTAQILNLSELARDVDVSVPTARRWLSVLEASLQVFLLPPYFDNLTKRLVKRPKMYFLDTGLAAYLTGWSSPETLAAGAMSGPMLETFVVVEILKSWWNRMKEPALFYLRDKDAREVDLLIECDDLLHPVEVKRTASPQPQWGRVMTPAGRVSKALGPGAVVCLAPARIGLAEGLEAVPVGLL